jgi:alanine racemase
MELAPTADPSLAGGRLTVDLDALVANWRALSDRARGAATSAVVKGDAYGIGLEPAARALAEAGCQTFFVALPEEGLRLRDAVRDATIYVLAGLVKGAAAAYEAAGLRPVLGSWPEIEEWATSRRGTAGGAGLHVDTGMNRLGLTLAEARKLAEHRTLRDAVSPGLVMSHLACADTPAHPLNRRQLATFRAVRALFPEVPASLANSAGILLGPEYHFDLTRPGIALYGGAPAEGAALRTVVRLEARILQIRDEKAGETVGYSAAETLRRPSRVAIVGVGYADGYHRAAGSDDQHPGARAYLHGAAVPLVGRVSMDLTAIDVTDLPDAARGDWVELFGPHVPLDEVARRAGTIGYELLTGLGRRYARRYLGLPD